MASRSVAPREADRGVALPGQETSQKLVGRLAAKYGVPPERLLGTLRDTVFKVKKDEQPFSDAEIAAALIVSEKYDLNPFAKQIYVTRNRGALLIIVPIDGWSAIVNRQPSYDGCEFEFEVDTEGNPLSCTCSIWDKRRGRPTRVTEYFDECFIPNREPWAKWPRRMLRHKAFIQAARIAFGLAGIIDDDEADRMETAQWRDVPRQRLVGKRSDEDPESPEDPEPEEQPPAPRRPAKEVKSQPPRKRSEEEIREVQAAWSHWEKIRGDLDMDELAACRQAAGVDYLNTQCTLDQINEAIAKAEEQRRPND